jgi:hypothetical protein
MTAITATNPIDLYQIPRSERDPARFVLSGFFVFYFEHQEASAAGVVSDCRHRSRSCLSVCVQLSEHEGSANCMMKSTIFFASCAALKISRLFF